MPTHVIEVNTRPGDPSAPIGEETVMTNLGHDGWHWTHTTSAPEPMTRQSHGPFSSEEEALRHAQMMLSGEPQS